MPYTERQELVKAVEEIRNGRRLICFLNFDRASLPQVPGLSTMFTSECKEALFRILKDTLLGKGKVDLFFFTRGGDVNSVWPIVSLIREFDPAFEVLVPFRCHSAGSLVSLGAKRIVMAPLAELSPVDPSVGNDFNPRNPIHPDALLPISVEDVQAYRDFIVNQFGETDDQKEAPDWRPFFHPALMKLLEQIHPLAVGNVHRSHQQIKQLARNLLGLNQSNKMDVSEIIKKLTTGFYSHYHCINRDEAVAILGKDKVRFAPSALGVAMDSLLRAYENDYELRKTFCVANFLKDETEKSARFIGGVVESISGSYLYETKVVFKQYPQIPPNLQVQIQPGQTVPFLPGFPRGLEFVVTAQAWIRNKEPKGVTLS